MGEIMAELNFINEEKSKLQDEHLKAWKTKGCKGTSIAATGLGKTRIGVLAIADTLKDINAEALVIVPTENLRDNEWINEFKKWGYESYLERIEFQCIQSAYKSIGRHWDIVIVDEVHTTLSLEYRKFYENNTWDKIYCFTATLPETPEYRVYLEDIAPIVKTTNLNQAKNLGLVSPYVVYNLGVSFTPEEALEYNRIDKIFKDCTAELGGSFVAFKNAGRLLKSNDTDKKKTAIIFYKMMNLRKQLCYNAFNKLLTVKQLTDKFDKRKTLIFSESIDFAEQIQTVVGSSLCSIFHSKMPKPVRKSTLEDFGNATGIRVLSSVKALNAGLNVPDCSLGICCAGSSKALDNIQRTGRTLRKVNGKQAVYINLYVKGSQEVKWVRTRTKEDHSVKWVDSIGDIS